MMTNTTTTQPTGTTPSTTTNGAAVNTAADNLFVANLQSVPLEKLVARKLEVLFEQQREANVQLSGLHQIVMEQVEKPLIELALREHRGNQVKTAQFLGINRNTLKKKIDNYKIRVRNNNPVPNVTVN
jgi:Fis family transcriptional regulator, factor for inversion stimulation protein